MAQVTLKGNPIHTNGDLPRVGAPAPAFRLTAGDLKDVTLADYKGKKKILNIVPSLDTAVCATSTRRFNESAGKLSNTVVLVVSGPALPAAAAASGRAAGAFGRGEIVLWRLAVAATAGARARARARARGRGRGR